MKPIVKWVGIIFVILILAAVSLPFLINVDRFRPTLESTLGKALGRKVALGNLHLNIMKGEVTADDLSVADDPAFGKPAFLRAKSLHVGVEIWPFLTSRKLIVTDLIVDQPEIDLVQAPSGDWNFSSLGGKPNAAPASAQPPPPPSDSTPLDLSVKLVKVSNGRLTLSRTVGHWKPLALEQVNIELRDFSKTTPSPFSLSAKVHGGGALQLDGQAGPLNPTDSAMTPVSVKLKASDLDLAASGMNDVAPNVTGLMSFDGSGESDGVNMHLKGNLKAEKLKLAKNGTPDTRPVQVDFAVNHDLRKHAGNLQQGDIHLGNAAAHVTGSYAEKGESLVLNLKLSGPGMPVQELEALLPAMGVVLPAGTSLKGGTASANLSIDGPSDRLVIAGSMGLNNTRLTSFDLAKKLGTIQKFTGIQASPDTEIQVLSTNLRSAPEGTNVQNLRLVVPALGEVTGAGTVSPANQLAFNMRAMVHATGLLAAVGNQSIPFTVGGTSSDPVFKPDLGAVEKEQLKNIQGTAKKAATDLLKGFLNGKRK